MDRKAEDIKKIVRDGYGKAVTQKTSCCSAPYKVLDEKFGFTAENVYRQVKEYLGQYQK